MPFQNVAIIGAGLSGLSLAIALQRIGIKSTVYEIRHENVQATPGAIMLCPNALRSLDAIGVYDRIEGKGYRFRNGLFRNNEHKTIDVYEMGNAEQYGYDAMRIYRQDMLDELRAIAREVGVEIRFGKKFSHVVEEGESGVRFACTNGDENTADILIGADGIHSAVRRYLFPDVKTVFSNVMSIITGVQTSAVRFPYMPYELPVSIHGEGGAFMLAPQGANGEELLLATQHKSHSRDRAGWDSLWNDKEQLFGLMRQDYDKWNRAVQSALDAVDPDKIFVWPFFSVPKLSSWKSAGGKVVILGDAAHAIPPAAGQGINQGFEDVHSLALLMAAANDKRAEWNKCLQWWQQYRQERVDHTAWLTDEMTRRRLPGWTGEGEESFDNSWLYGVRIVDDVNGWLANQ